MADDGYMMTGGRDENTRGHIVGTGAEEIRLGGGGGVRPGRKGSAE